MMLEESQILITYAHSLNRLLLIIVSLAPVFCSWNLLTACGFYGLPPCASVSECKCLIAMQQSCFSAPNNGVTNQAYFHPGHLGIDDGGMTYSCQQCVRSYLQTPIKGGDGKVQKRIMTLGKSAGGGGQFCSTDFIADYSNDYCRRGLGNQMDTALNNMVHAKKNAELQAALEKQESSKNGLVRGEVKREVLTKEDGMDGAAPTVTAMENGIKGGQALDEYGWQIMPSPQCAAEVQDACALDRGFRERDADPRVQQLIAFWEEKDEDVTGTKMVQQMKKYGMSTASERRYLKTLMPDSPSQVIDDVVSVMADLDSRQRATVLGSLVHVSANDQMQMLKCMRTMATGEKSNFIAAMSHASIEDQAKMMLKIEIMAVEEKRLYLSVMGSADAHDQARIINVIGNMRTGLATRFLQMVEQANTKLQPKIVTVMSGMNHDEMETFVSVMSNARRNQRRRLQNDIVSNMDVMTGAQKRRFMQVGVLCTVCICAVHGLPVF
jgi:hypothetical protein